MKPRAKSAFIRDQVEFKVDRGDNPPVGQYDGHLKDFAADMNKVDFGSKYKF